MQSAPISLNQVRRLFASPARVEGGQFLLREIANRMAEKLDLIKIDANHVLDVGCGVGVDLLRLSERFPDASSIVGLDGSYAALLQAPRSEVVANGVSDSFFNRILSIGNKRKRQIDLVCADFANLPIRSNRFDVLWSNLALHWHPTPDLVLREWFRVMEKNGIVMFSSFGPDTFIELKQAFSEIDDFPHVLPFVDMHDFGDMLVAAGFATPVMDVERITLRYAKLEQLFADLKALGGNPMTSRRPGLLGRHAMAKLCAQLEKSRADDGRIPLTIEVVFGHAFKPVPTKLASGESIIRLDFPKK
jgi:malonyl-CoA O-methyltransferase